jgi:hypothetical protein
MKTKKFYAVLEYPADGDVFQVFDDLSKANKYAEDTESEDGSQFQVIECSEYLFRTFNPNWNNHFVWVGNSFIRSSDEEYAEQEVEEMVKSSLRDGPYCLLEEITNNSMIMGELTKPYFSFLGGQEYHKFQKPSEIMIKMGLRKFLKEKGFTVYGQAGIVSKKPLVID